MISATVLPIGIVALAVLVPLGYEYALLRRELGLGRLGAVLAASTLFPALPVGIAVSLPLAASPVFQWTVTVTVTLALYSFVIAGLSRVARQSA